LIILDYLHLKYDGLAYKTLGRYPKCQVGLEITVRKAIPPNGECCFLLMDFD
jgi:hypothetical protein